MGNPVKDELFQRHYFTPNEPASFTSSDKLARATQKSKKAAQKWLTKQDTYTLHKPIKKRYPRRKVIVSSIDQQWQADLVDMTSLVKFNSGYKFLLTCIDVMSKHAWVVPLKDKTGASLKRAFSKIFKSGRIPRKLQTDRGTEFYNRTLKTFLEKHDVKLFSTHNYDTKACIVERFNRTLKTKMWKYFTQNNTLKYTNVLKDLVDSYNSTYHTSIKMAPANVRPEHQELLWQRLYGDGTPTRPKLKAGDTVRVSKIKGTFSKGYLANWSEEIFVVDKILRTAPVTYTLCDLAGESLQGSFYNEELQKVTKVDDVWKIEKIMKTRYRNKKKQVLVRWRGFPPKFDMWIDAEGIKTL